jgi:hypothetical protein
MRRTMPRLMLAVVFSTVLALLLLPAIADAQGGRGGGGGRGSGGGSGAGAGARPPGAGAPPGGAPPSAGARPPGGQPGRSGPGGRPPAYYGGRAYAGGYYGYYGYPYWGFGWGWGGPYWYGAWGYPSPYWGYYDPTPEIRLEVKPKQAQVYVDGYFAGIVDDFDGTFQRLRLRAGTHELTLYLEGYRTVRQNLHVGQGQDSKIKFQMEPLGAGEPNEPPPAPKNPPADEPEMGVPLGPPPREPSAPDRPMPEPRGVVVAQGFGTLVLRVQPPGSEVLIDGERWQGPEGSERLVVQVSEGSHRVEVRKEGFVPFSATIQVRPGETAPLNVSLPPRGE